jgi:YHS domain-containing protein
MRRLIAAGLAGIALSGCYVEEKHDRVGVYRYGHIERELDPVCGLEADPLHQWKEEVQGRTYYFHEEQCRNKFREHPQAYVEEGDPPQVR